LSEDRKPFCEEEYLDCDRKRYPILNVLCRFWEKEVPLRALADTGCDSGIVLLKEEVQILKEKIVGFALGEKINDEPIEISVADGHIVGADAYLVIIELGGEQREVDLLVVDSDNIIRKETEEKKEKEDIFPLVGRNFLNHFDVLFKGKEKKLAVFK